MCVEIVLKIFKIYKNKFKNSAKFHRNIYSVLYASKNVRAFKIFWKNSKSQNMCWNFFGNFFKYPKVCCLYFLKDSAEFHRKINYVLYAWNLRVLKLSEKLQSPKMCVEIFLKIFKVCKSVLCLLL